MDSPLPFSAVGRLPAPGDNVAIAVRRLEAGTRIAQDGSGLVRLAHTVLEGHRFAVRGIEPGEALLSWGAPFGRARLPIVPGDYVCNAAVLEELARRRLDVEVPAAANFTDVLEEYRLDESAFVPGRTVERVPVSRTFRGYRRPGTRGVGTRNTIVVLGTTSRTAAFARRLAARMQAAAREHAAIDGIVAVAHTEGGGTAEPNNALEVLRCLAGFVVHPNVGAVLAVDVGVEPITNARLRAFMVERGYPLNDVRHAFLSVRHGLAAGLATGEAIVRGWLAEVGAERRTEAPLSELRVALQCGGSDAFSGVSGNPLAGAVVHEVVRHGGTGVLCETDELVGAEDYVVRNIRDLDTARALLGHVAAFRARLAAHGVTPEANPSGGNRLRGLYNIALKALGAAHKKDPRTRIEHVSDYALPLPGSGFCFMNSPGNDLEAIAGQVAAGCNLVLFVTGNGSVTNFPFAPTLKITTTSRRHELLVQEMDIDAGRFLDGAPMEALAAEAFELVLATASGLRSKGEAAGHTQTSLWRDWRQRDATGLDAIRARPVPDGRPLREVGGGSGEAAGPIRATERIGLVLPTSLCSAQIARLAVERLGRGPLAQGRGVDRFVALPHSEGCGFAGESLERALHVLYRGYATHPNVVAALLLEHGCEKTTNAAVRVRFEESGVSPDRFGWASVQLDGGIEKATTRIERWFDERLPVSAEGADERVARPESDALPAGLVVAFLAAGVPGPEIASACAALACDVLAVGGSVLLAEGDPLLASPEFASAVCGSVEVRATVSHGEPLARRGLHVVATDTTHWVENLAGLGGCGAQLVVGVVVDGPQPGHPLIPVVLLASGRVGGAVAVGDVDLCFEAESDASRDGATRLRELVVDVVHGRRVPSTQAGGFVDFQISRGLLGVTA
ncbi:hypothetical protein ASA1KI_03330 [Opitutales bacterium ASA1]|uniref:UxaA family hydrolase n=1 Tax=Congregicoccus parvus TaxID=3081749 RepID=UPI002B2DD4B5|nr:hypothetical protein ASA1KI_03330 [Opitutales bacterium ASA1]